MHGLINGIRSLADIFHDIDLPAQRPGGVAAHHPESRPDALPRGQFHARFHSSILEFLQPARINPRRRIRQAFIVFQAALNDQVAIFHSGVFGPVGIILHFHVTPPAPALVENPILGIDACAIEFIRPYQFPSLGIPGVGGRWRRRCGGLRRSRPASA